MANKVIDKMKKMFTDEYEDDYEYEDEYEETEEVEDEDDSYEAIQPAPVNNVVNMHHTMKVVIYAPKIYEDVAQIADSLKQKKTVVVNLDDVVSSSVKKSIFDFINGAVYVLEGSIQKVTGTIFIIAPNNVDIDANVKKELESRALFPWQK